MRVVVVTAELSTRSAKAPPKSNATSNTDTTLRNAAPNSPFPTTSGGITRWLSSNGPGVHNARPHPAYTRLRWVQPVRRKRGGLTSRPLRETLGAPACRISIAGCWSMPAISKLRMTGAAGLGRGHRTVAARSCEGEECVQAGAVHEDEPREIESQNSSPGANSPDCLRESRRRGEVQLSRQPNTTRMGERRNVKAGDTTGLTFPRYRSTYARSPGLRRVCSRASRLSACLTLACPRGRTSRPALRRRVSHVDTVAMRANWSSTSWTDSPSRHRDSVSRRSPWRSRRGARLLFLVADERIYGWSSWPL